MDVAEYVFYRTFLKSDFAISEPFFFVSFNRREFLKIGLEVEAAMLN
jgi:hypothetical protein